MATLVLKGGTDLTNEDFDELVIRLLDWRNAIELGARLLGARDEIQETNREVAEMLAELDGAEKIIADGYEALGHQSNDMNALDISVLYTQPEDGDCEYGSDDVTVEYLKGEEMGNVIEVLSIALAKAIITLCAGKEALDEVNGKAAVEQIANAVIMKALRMAIKYATIDFDDEEDEEDDG